MDGVLSNFLKKFTEFSGSTPKRDYNSNNAAKSAYKKHFDDFITENNFATLEPMSDLTEALSFLGSIEDSYTIKLLSSTAQEKYLVEVSKQKEMWLTNWEIAYPAIFVPGKKLKQLYATPDSILIDDTQSSIIEWRERGGLAVHHITWEQTIIELTAMLHNHNKPV